MMKEGNYLIGGYSTPIFIYRTKHLTYSNIKVSGEQLHCGPKICFCRPVFNFFFGQSTLFLAAGDDGDKMFLLQRPDRTIVKL